MKRSEIIQHFEALKFECDVFRESVLNSIQKFRERTIVYNNHSQCRYFCWQLSIGPVGCAQKASFVYCPGAVIEKSSGQIDDTLIIVGRDNWETRIDQKVNQFVEACNQIVGFIKDLRKVYLDDEYVDEIDLQLYTFAEFGMYLEYFVSKGFCNLDLGANYAIGYPYSKSTNNTFLGVVIPTSCSSMFANNSLFDFNGYFKVIDNRFATKTRVSSCVSLARKGNVKDCTVDFYLRDYVHDGESNQDLDNWWENINAIVLVIKYTIAIEHHYEEMRRECKRWRVLFYEMINNICCKNESGIKPKYFFIFATISFLKDEEIPEWLDHLKLSDNQSELIVNNELFEEEVGKILDKFEQDYWKLMNDFEVDAFFNLRHFQYPRRVYFLADVAFSGEPWEDCWHSWCKRGNYCINCSPQCIILGQTISSDGIFPMLTHPDVSFFASYNARELIEAKSKNRTLGFRHREKCSDHVPCNDVLTWMYLDHEIRKDWYKSTLYKMRKIMRSMYLQSCDLRC